MDGGTKICTLKMKVGYKNTKNNCFSVAIYIGLNKMVKQTYM